MAVIPGDWVKRQWRVAIENPEQLPSPSLTEYKAAAELFSWGEKEIATPASPVVLQERQYIPDDQQWGEWVTIMKSEGIPHE